MSRHRVKADVRLRQYPDGTWAATVELLFSNAPSLVKTTKGHLTKVAAQVAADSILADYREHLLRHGFKIRSWRDLRAVEP